MPDPDTNTDAGVSPLPLPEQPPMDDAAGGPQADDADGDVDDDMGNRMKPHTPVTD